MICTWGGALVEQWLAISRVAAAPLLDGTGLEVTGVGPWGAVAC